MSDDAEDIHAALGVANGGGDTVKFALAGVTFFLMFASAAADVGRFLLELRRAGDE